MKQYIILMLVGLALGGAGGWLWGEGYFKFVTGQPKFESVDYVDAGGATPNGGAARDKAQNADKLSLWPQAQASWGRSGDKKLKKGDLMPSDLFIRLAKKVNPAVVNISIVAPRRMRSLSQRGPLFFDFFEQFGPFMAPDLGAPDGAPRGPQTGSAGTGFIIRPDGLILTNAHVIGAMGPQAQVNVKLSGDKKLYIAQRVGHDDRTDIALIKIKSENKLPVIQLGNSSELEVGEWVAAFGNPFQQSNTLTVGVVSFIGREIKNLNKVPLIQTDASINPGNSGGPLVNINGEAIGVNAAIDARAQGIGFAIPVDGIKPLLPQLEKYGTIQRGFLGVYMRDVDSRIARNMNLPSTKGALIVEVGPRTPAQKAGIRPYDFIVKFGDRAIRGSADLSRVVQDSPVGQNIQVELLRAEAKKTAPPQATQKIIKKIVAVRLQPHPDSQRSARKVQPKTYRGQKAPFDLGFYVANWSPSLKREFSLPPLPRAHPVVIELVPGSRAAQAGLRVGDVVLDVNKQLTTRSTQVLQYLQAQTANIIRVQRGNRAYLIYIP